MTAARSGVIVLPPDQIISVVAAGDVRVLTVTTYAGSAAVRLTKAEASDLASAFFARSAFEMTVAGGGITTQVKVIAWDEECDCGCEEDRDRCVALMILDPERFIIKAALPYDTTPFSRLLLGLDLQECTA